MKFTTYLEEMLPREAKALYEGSQAREIKFKNFDEFMNTVMSGDLGISLELSGKKDGKKVFLRLNGKNLNEVIEKYDDYFDDAMDMEQREFLVKSIMQAATKQVKENDYNMSGPVEVDANINEPEEPIVDDELNDANSPDEFEEPEIEEEVGKKRDTAETQEF